MQFLSGIVQFGKSSAFKWNGECKEKEKLLAWTWERFKYLIYHEIVTTVLGIKSISGSWIVTVSRELFLCEQKNFNK